MSWAEMVEDAKLNAPPRGEWTGDRLQRELYEDIALRAEHPALDEAWERYMVLHKLFKAG